LGGGKPQVDNGYFHPDPCFPAGSSLTRQSRIANPTGSKASALYHNEMDMMYRSCKIFSSKFFFEIASEDNYFFAE
jgi:hypothetical protein